ncbi:MAG: ThiF family adenylyltransferase [Bdellovibrionaceae bacterium]|nr:ThiF family adenylyltransferase [Pseudobdellovibrionaceae bacterium]
MSLKKFDYSEAFSRNIGWVTEEEQSKIKKYRVAIAGLGGVGGNYLLTLCRLGITKFHISDFDQFELGNFNRQVGATVTNVGKNKLEVMAEMAKDINPEVEIRSFPQGVNEQNLDEFLDGVDVYLDGLDVFCLDLREKLFERANIKNIHALTVAPVGMGASLVHFPPKGMVFEKYFGLSLAKNQAEKALRFVLGVAPLGLHAKSLMLKDRLDFKNKKAPSTFMGCQLCAGVAGTEILKLVLHRGPILKAPYSIHFDAYSYQYKKKYLWWGHANPFHRIKLRMLAHHMAHLLGAKE